MERSHSFSRPSPSSGQARSPSPKSANTPRTRMPSRGRPESHRTSSHHGSRSRSSSRSSSRSPSHRRHHQHHHQHQHSQPQHEHNHGLFKTSAGLIAGIGLATVLARKVWPKGVLYDGDQDESRPKSKHHHHHHHSSERHEHHHRRSSDAGRMVDRARSVHPHGEVMFVDEAGPFKRGDSRRMSLDPRTLRAEDERMLRDAHSPRSRPAVLPYPETPYPNEKFYEPVRMRAVPEPVFISR
ncbi:hypothetical protein G7Z17_g7563 [Cylindrodendrum hubeiense]|uniref:Uncharacterized protein n=1 Tax=Cylindrodendrum hubeiense TaxID=595255 RepID=A0A9P5H828_9HYPO|nr:hypothetical protein G7Z17_g7563 [Cylindrodendrum hubeiense]